AAGQDGREVCTHHLTRGRAQSAHPEYLTDGGKAGERHVERYSRRNARDRHRPQWYRGVEGEERHRPGKWDRSSQAQPHGERASGVLERQRLIASPEAADL